MAKEIRSTNKEPADATTSGSAAAAADAAAQGGEGVGEHSGYGSVSEGGLEFWSRQSDLWSGVFTEQQTGLLQMVRAQEAELRQGKRRISSLEQELSKLNDKRAEMAAAAAAGAGEARRGSQEAGAAGGGRRSLKEAEASDWRQRLERMQADYERRVSVLKERESAVVAAEVRVESRARELGEERDRLSAGAVALSAEADGLRFVAAALRFENQCCVCLALVPCLGVQRSYIDDY